LGFDFLSFDNLADPSPTFAVGALHKIAAHLDAQAAGDAISPVLRFGPEAAIAAR